ncbi:DMT family transporter [Bradyrhizobium sp. 48]|uniref:DMT family transporter n=1 Tax=Bradyrhizobium sp. 48 TaxID=2782676 RepID=UPI001FF867D6|nr:DMT family transporter [Bradyrhizobium sp. 48]MCK1447077.1 DMT family transporter [Bradyrhizobium sp. 48]
MTDTKALFAAAITVLLWSSAFPGIRAALEGYPPGHLVLLRFLIASVSLGIVALVTRLPAPSLADLPGMLLLGVIGIGGYQTALTFGQQTVSAGAAALAVALTPVFMALIGTVFLGERLAAAAWSGTVLSFVGIAIVSLGENGSLKWSGGIALVVLAALATSVFFVLQKPYLRRYSPLQMTTIGIWAGTIIMAFIWLPGLTRSIQQAPVGATAAVLYLAILPGTVAYVTWAYALSKAPASVLGNAIYLEPPLAIVVCYLWLGELPALLTVCGGAIALLGVVITSVFGSSRQIPP